MVKENLTFPPEKELKVLRNLKAKLKQFGLLKAMWKVLKVLELLRVLKVLRILKVLEELLKALKVMKAKLH